MGAGLIWISLKPEDRRDFPGAEPDHERENRVLPFRRVTAIYLNGHTGRIRRVGVTDEKRDQNKKS